MTQTLAIHMKKHSSARNLNTAVLRGEEFENTSEASGENIQTWANIFPGSSPPNRPGNNNTGLDLTSQRFEISSGINGHWGAGICPPIEQSRY